jgi:hypothetical protein
MKELKMSLNKSKINIKKRKHNYSNLCKKEINMVIELIKKKKIKKSKLKSLKVNYKNK